MKYLIFIWTAFTAALAVWWWILGLRLLQMQQILPGADVIRLQSIHRMFMAEGSVLVLLIISGGIALGISFWKIRLQNQALREFFASFTHEVKTALTNLRLQTELLQEEGLHASAVPLRRLLMESQRLELQFENSLQLAQGDAAKQFLEEIDLQSFLHQFRPSWPGLEIQLKFSEPVRLMTDRKALEVIFRNLLQNAVVHGEAKKFFLETKSNGKNWEFHVSNDGKKFNGDFSQLGKMFLRHEGSSGTGIGLAMVKRLMRRLGGDVSFKLTESSQLEVILAFPRGVHP